jgi:ribose/xylose/arabinose/galactoside ABC-type transport system permease subunit
VLVGLANGFIVTKLKINPFITTLGTMTILRGVVLVVTKSMPPSGFPQSFFKIAWGSVLGIPNPVIIMAVATVSADLLMRNLSYLRQAYFVGSNEEAARLCGLSTGTVKTFAFAVTGFLSALAGIIVASRANAVDPNEGSGAELRVIAAVIVGGASLSGGRGTILGSFLGLMLMEIISTGLVFVNVAPEAQLIAVGLVLIVAGVIDQVASTLGQVMRSFFASNKNKSWKEK